LVGEGFVFVTLFSFSSFFFLRFSGGRKGFFEASNKKLSLRTYKARPFLSKSQPLT